MATEAAGAGAAPLTEAERATLGALLERMFPADELGPGAGEIGAPEYISRALGGAYAELAPVYRRARFPGACLAVRRSLDLIDQRIDQILKYRFCVG